MIPAGVASALGISIPELLATAPEALALRRALEIARGQDAPQAAFFRFVNAAVAANADLSRSAAAQLYRAAKAWSSVPGLLQQYATDQPFDPNLARPSDQYGQFAGAYGGFITRVKVTVFDPATGDSRTYGVTVHDEITWSFSDIESYAISTLEEIVGHSPTLGGQTDLEGLSVNVSVTDFIRII
jgi:hypothetical protein